MHDEILERVRVADAVFPVMYNIYCTICENSSPESFNDTAEFQHNQVYTRVLVATLYLIMHGNDNADVYVRPRGSDAAHNRRNTKMYSNSQGVLTMY